MKGKSHPSPILQSSQTPRPDSPDPLPEVFLNHFYMVLDSPTYHAIEEDSFLRKHLAVNEKRTTTNADMTYTGLYFYGVQTYFEFFDVADSSPHRVADCGIAFGVDQPGAVSVLQEKLGSSLEPSLKPVTRLYQGKQIPWFLMATPRSFPYEGRTSSWVMEYHPEFLASWNPQPSGTNRGMSRREILKRYAEVLAPIDQPRLEDVIGLTVAADSSATDNLIHFCLQLGYQIDREQDGGVSLHGPEFILQVLRETENVRGIREIRMRFRSLPQGEMERPMGRSVMKVDGPLAIWSFR
ncbi:MAG TPA: DUF5829 family protein [Terriglobales bacterium]|nr:DUF5829 family protein [Terriglobales bacterium]